MPAAPTPDLPAVLAALDGAWTGTMRLWLEADAPPDESGSTATLIGGRLHWTWSFGGAPKAGWIDPADLTWADSFHQPEPKPLRPMPRPGALLSGDYTYPAPEGPDWGWQVVLSQRPDGALVLQMTNLCPWGESAPAVMAVWARA
jgi:hypothetical protein